MASAIDATKPVQGNPTTQSVRENFAAAKSEIELLQQTAGVGPQGPIGNTGPSGTITVNPTVITGNPGTNAGVTIGGTPQAATVQFTIPRGDAGTGGAGITETQAQDAVRQGQVRFEEATVTNATIPSSGTIHTAPVLGANWALTSGSGATGTYTHTAPASGTLEPIAYPITGNLLANEIYEIQFTVTNTALAVASGGQWNELGILYARQSPTETTGQQTVATVMAASSSGRVILQHTYTTAPLTHLVFLPRPSQYQATIAWTGTFILTFVRRIAPPFTSATFNIKDQVVTAGSSGIVIGGGTPAPGRLVSSNNSSVVIGNASGARLHSGGNNVVLGANAMPRATTASSNIAIGASVLSSNLVGGSNVAIGNSAMSSSVSASNNVAFGGNALSNCVSGSNNFAWGEFAGNAAISGQYNICLGSWAMAGYTGPPGPHRGGTAGYNIVLGYYAALMTKTCQNNIILGQYSLSNNEDGSDNIAIGREAGRYLEAGAAMTQCNESIFIGRNTRGSAANDQTNQIVIGVGAIGHGSNTITLGNTSITDIYANVPDFSVISDSRVKENIAPVNLDACLDAVRNLPVSTWDWQPIAGARRDKHATGFLADDVAKVFPTAVTKHDESLTVCDKDGKVQMQTVTEMVPQWDSENNKLKAPERRTIEVPKMQEFKDLQRMHLTEALPTLWGAVQRLIAKNEELEKQLAELSNGTPPANNKSDKPASHSKKR